MLILGSKSENERLTALLSKSYHEDRRKSQKPDVIETIQGWLKKQHHLPQMTDDQISVFLHACYHSAEKAKETIDNYFTFRMQAPELFTNRNPKKTLSDSFNVAYYLLLSEECKSHDKNTIVILRLRKTDPALANFPLEVKTCLALLDFVIARFPFCNGIEVIMDMEGLALAHITKIDFSALRKFMSYVQEAMPLRLKGIHVINTIPLIHHIMTILKPLIKADLFNIIHFHTTADFGNFCNKYIPQHVLPSDFGGEQESMETIQEKTYQDLILATDWLKELEDYKVDESKRMERPKWNEVNGVAGTFKKLEID